MEHQLLSISEDEAIPYDVMYSRASELIESSEDNRYIEQPVLIRFLRAREFKVDQALTM